MEHRGIRYEIKVAIGRSQWTWIAHTPPKPREGSIEGAKRDATLAAEKAIDRYIVASGLKMAVFAAEPQLANPVALWIDERGRAWVVETLASDHVPVVAEVEIK